MNKNDNNIPNDATGIFDTTGDLKHIKEIEDMLEKRSGSKSDTEAAPAPRKYVRRKPYEVANTPKENAENESTIIINRVADKKPEKDAGEKTPQQNEIKEKSSSGIVSSRENAVKKKTPVQKAGETPKEEYTPLFTENDDFEIDENPEPEPREGAIGALTSVAKAIIYLVAVITVSVALAVAVISVANDVFAFVKSDESVTVVVPENCDTETLAGILHDAGAIKYPGVFKTYVKIKKYSSEYLPGTYEISPMLNYDYMIYEFKEKKAERTTVVVTIPEGYSTDQIVKLLVDKGLGTYEGYKRAINEYDFEYRFLENQDSFSSDRYWRLDGYLYPDTYYYYSDSTEETIIYKMLENFNNKITEEYYERANELQMSLDDLITLASLIQKEVRFADEYGNVSSVFHNRLNSPANFPYLDSDATIVYAIEHETGSRPEVLKETSYDSPYNTYKNRGLPPGPIANPSLEAIRYAMYPNSTRYYYFVSGPDGRTTFSKTYPEHQEAINELYGE